MPDLLRVFIFAASSFAILFIISKLLGRKQIAELDFIDYIVGISIGSIAAEMATELEKDFWVYIIAMGVFFVLDFVVSYLARKASWMKRFFKGTPLILVKDGKINFKELKRSKIDINDLLSLARSKGYFKIESIAVGVFETTGELSVLPVSEQRPLVLSDLGKKEKPATFPVVLVIDGAISSVGLDMLKKNKKWLYQKLNLKSSKDVKGILFAVYDYSIDKIKVQNKKDDKKNL